MDIDWNKTNRYNFDSPAGIVRWSRKGRWAAFPMTRSGVEQIGLLLPTKEAAMSFCKNNAVTA
jgi:hypothetical protein